MSVLSSLFERGSQHFVAHADGLGDLDHHTHLWLCEIALPPTIDRSHVERMHLAELGQAESGALERCNDQLFDGLSHAAQDSRTTPKKTSPNTGAVVDYQRRKAEDDRTSASPAPNANQNTGPANTHLFRKALMKTLQRTEHAINAPAPACGHQADQAVGFGLYFAGELRQFDSSLESARAAMKALARGNWPVLVRPGDCVACSAAQWQAQEDALRESYQARRVQ